MTPKRTGQPFPAAVNVPVAPDERWRDPQLPEEGKEPNLPREVGDLTQVGEGNIAFAPSFQTASNLAGVASLCDCECSWNFKALFPVVERPV